MLVAVLHQYIRAHHRYDLAEIQECNEECMPRLYHNQVHLIIASIYHYVVQ